VNGSATAAAYGAMKHSTTTPAGTRQSSAAHLRETRPLTIRLLFTRLFPPFTATINLIIINY
jgi:hypothetical protein